MPDSFSVREISESDIGLLADYWTSSDPEFLVSMGVDLLKMPRRADLVAMLSEQLSLDYHLKKSYAIIWLINGQPAGHSNINKINFGEDAFMHLHLWNSLHRRKGAGTALVKLTLPYFFSNFHLKKIFCEPYALNPAPHRTLEKAGFHFVKNYHTVPGSLNFEQDVKLWEMSVDQFQEAH